MKKHYYTVKFDEYGSGANGWALEGSAAKVFSDPQKQPGLVPVFHMVNDQGDHYYTTAKYVPGRGLDGYTYVGPAFYVFKFKVPGSIPFFEYYSLTGGGHFYTTDQNELGPGAQGYRFDTVIGYVLPK